MITTRVSFLLSLALPHILAVCLKQPGAPLPQLGCSEGLSFPSNLSLLTSARCSPTLKCVLVGKLTHANLCIRLQSGKDRCYGLDGHFPVFICLTPSKENPSQRKSALLASSNQTSAKLTSFLISTSRGGYRNLVLQSLSSNETNQTEIILNGEIDSMAYDEGEHTVYWANERGIYNRSFNGQDKAHNLVPCKTNSLAFYSARRMLIFIENSISISFLSKMICMRNLYTGKTDMAHLAIDSDRLFWIEGDHVMTADLPDLTSVRKLVTLERSFDTDGDLLTVSHFEDDTAVIVCHMKYEKKFVYYFTLEILSFENVTKCKKKVSLKNWCFSIQMYQSVLYIGFCEYHFVEVYNIFSNCTVAFDKKVPYSGSRFGKNQCLVISALSQKISSRPQPWKPSSQESKKFLTSYLITTHKGGKRNIVLQSFMSKEAKPTSVTLTGLIDTMAYDEEEHTVYWANKEGIYKRSFNGQNKTHKLVPSKTNSLAFYSAERVLIFIENSISISFKSETFYQKNLYTGKTDMAHLAIDADRLFWREGKHVMSADLPDFKSVQKMVTLEQFLDTDGDLLTVSHIEDDIVVVACDMKYEKKFMYYFTLEILSFNGVKKVTKCKKKVHLKNWCYSIQMYHTKLYVGFCESRFIEVYNIFTNCTTKLIKTIKYSGGIFTPSHCIVISTLSQE